MTRLRFALVLIVSVSLTAGPAGAAPSNDAFASAKVLAGDELTESFEYAGSTTQAGEPLNCGGTAFGSTIWYRIDVASEARIAVSTAGSVLDHVIVIYQGTALGSLTMRSCGSSSGTAASQFRLTATAAAGQRYYVQVGTINGDTGPLSINIVAAKPPANETMSGAVTITAEPFVRTIDMRTAREDGWDSRCVDFFDRDSSVWYRYTPPTTRTLLVDTTGTAFPHGAAIFDDDGSDRACRSSAGEITAPVEAGRPYFIAVFGTQGRSGVAQLRVEAPPAPPHDAFDNAKTIPSSLTSPYSDLVRTLGASPAPDGEGCAGATGRTVWYRWTPAEPVRFLVAIGDTIPRLDWMLGVVAEVNETRATIWCGTRSLGLISPRLAEFQSVAVPGVTYYFQLGGVLSDGGTADFAVIPL